MTRTILRNIRDPLDGMRTTLRQLRDERRRLEIALIGIPQDWLPSPRLRDLDLAIRELHRSTREAVCRRRALIAAASG